MTHITKLLVYMTEFTHIPESLTLRVRDNLSKDDIIFKNNCSGLHGGRLSN